MTRPRRAGQLISSKAKLTRLSLSAFNSPSGHLSFFHFTSPDLLPTSQHDHNIFIYNPKLTSSEHKRTGATSIQPIEDQLGLIAWALDRNGDKTKEMVMGFWRQDEVEEKEEGAVDEEDEEDEEIEEWLEVRLRLVKVRLEGFSLERNFHTFPLVRARNKAEMQKLI